MFGEFWVFFFCVVLKGIDDFEKGFMYKVDYRKSSKIMFTLSMPQKAPKRRSPNTVIISSNEQKALMWFQP